MGASQENDLGGPGMVAAGGTVLRSAHICHSLAGGQGVGADGVQECVLYGKTMRGHGGLGGPGYENKETQI